MEKGNIAIFVLNLHAYWSQRAPCRERRCRDSEARMIGVAPERFGDGDYNRGKNCSWVPWVFLFGCCFQLTSLGLSQLAKGL